jgi:hypothetical protein
MDFDARTFAVVVAHRGSRSRGVPLMIVGLPILVAVILLGPALELETRKTIALCLLPGALTLWGLILVLRKQVITADGWYGRGSEMSLGRCRLDLDLRYGGEVRALEPSDETMLVAGRGNLSLDVSIVKANGTYVGIAVRLSQADGDGVSKPLFTVAREPKSVQDLILLITNSHRYGLGAKLKDVGTWLTMLEGVVESAFPGLHLERRVLLYPDTVDGAAAAFTFGIVGAIAAGVANAAKRGAMASEAAEGELHTAMTDIGWRLEAGM